MPIGGFREKRRVVWVMIRCLVSKKWRGKLSDLVQVERERQENLIEDMGQEAYEAMKEQEDNDFKNWALKQLELEDKKKN